MATTHLQKMTTRAKRLRKEHPRLSWQDALKRAAKDLKKTSRVGAYKVIERGEPKAARPSATYQVDRTKAGTFRGMKKVGSVTIEGVLKETKKAVLEKIGILEANKFSARLKSDRAKISKEIAHLKSLYRKMA